jgi:hypothetical protein
LCLGYLVEVQSNIINHITRTFPFGQDIAYSLEHLEEYNVLQHKPTLIRSESYDEEIPEMENKQFQIEFQAEYDNFRKRKQHYETNVFKAYALLWEQSSRSMQNKIEAHPNYATKIRGSPIELLKNICQHFLNYHENRYEMSIIFDAMRNFINLRQKDGELLQEYTKRFKAALDVLTTHLGGPIQLTRYIRSLKGYDQED